SCSPRSRLEAPSAVASRRRPQLGPRRRPPRGRPTGRSGGGAARRPGGAPGGRPGSPDPAPPRVALPTHPEPATRSALPALGARAGSRVRATAHRSTGAATTPPTQGSPRRPAAAFLPVTTLRTSPLDAVHRALGAKMVPFGGWEMPLQYPSGTLAEHRACREGVAVFDVSHLGTVRVEGPEALDRLQRALTNDLRKI